MTKIFSLDGKVALMTGASRGLGRAMALALAAAGAHVVVNGRNEAGIEKTKQAIIAAGGKATATAFDTTDIVKADAAIDRIEKELGHLDTGQQRRLRKRQDRDRGDQRRVERDHRS